MHLFYTPDIGKDQKTYILSEDESKHCIRVLRLTVGAKVNLIDGIGNLFSATIIDPHPKRTGLAVMHLEAAFGKRNHYLHIAIAPTKNLDRLEWFLEKATEIGVDEITPIICDRSERKEIKWDRLNKVITAAMKQSLSAYHPKLNHTKRITELLNEPFSGQRFLAHCLDEEKQFLTDVMIPFSNYMVFIGPEGDFSPSEVDHAIVSACTPISLGESRLRTETAGLAACFEVNYLNR